MTTQSRVPLPHQREERARREEQRRAHAVKLTGEELDVVNQMQTVEGRRVAWGLYVRAGLISLRLGNYTDRDPAISPTVHVMTTILAQRHGIHRFDQIVREKCNDLWLLMREENEHQLENPHV